MIGWYFSEREIRLSFEDPSSSLQEVKPKCGWKPGSISWSRLRPIKGPVLSFARTAGDLSLLPMEIVAYMDTLKGPCLPTGQSDFQRQLPKGMQAKLSFISR